MDLLQVKDLKVRYGGFEAVRGVSFTIKKGEIFGLVGESGCGKTTVGRAIAGICDAEGSVKLNGKERIGKKCTKQIQMIFQDPTAALNMRKTVQGTLLEALGIKGRSGQKGRESVCRLLEAVSLPHDAAGCYPCAFSGGQRQRICIARAIAARPELIIADEPISALDVSLQGQIMELICSLSTKMGIAVLFISHDLSAVRHYCSTVAVMHSGKIVEKAKCHQIFNEPLDPYTRCLLANAPYPDPIAQRNKSIYIYNGKDNVGELTDVGGGHFVCKRV